MTAPVTAVVLSWNGKEDTLACLRSLEAATYPELSIVAVDNNSHDGSPEAVAAAFPRAHVVRLDENRGFAGGVNVGIEAAIDAGAAYVFLLNNDATAEAGSLEPLVEALDQRPTAAAACSQIVFLDRPDVIWYAGASFRRRRGYHGRNRGYGKPRLPPETTPYETDRACGGAMLIRSTALGELGGFDDALFAYAEDTDWSLRAASRGASVLVVPASVVRHAVSSSSGGASSPDPIYYGLRNGLVVAERWAPLGAVRTWLRRLEAVAASLAQAAASGNVRPGIRAVRDGWRDFRASRLGPRRRAA
ncbi:MAG TPA: glycosyltransferase family 2 protein [Gaiella sp.]|nr:glycosyltransferase family 2 protein [Gaiella sp.]